MNYLFTLLYVSCLCFPAHAKTNVKHSHSCEHKKVSLNCPNGKIVDVLDGKIGASASTCMKGSIKNISCFQDIIIDLCEGYRKCIIEANNNIFADPCAGKLKYLFVFYHCVALQEVKVGLACDPLPLKLECETGKVIQIQSANYGRRSQTICPDGPILTTNCIADQATDIVSGLCNLKRTCSVMATHTIFGDPCFGTYKYLSVKYRCVPESGDCCSKTTPIIGQQCLDDSIILPSLLCERKRDCPHADYELMCSYDTIFICEHQTMEIKCSKDERIKIINANYGRTSTKICPRKDRTDNTNCRAGNTKHILKQKCNGKQTCEIKSANKIFGDPCEGIVKYLEVQYDCEPVTFWKTLSRVRRDANSYSYV